MSDLQIGKQIKELAKKSDITIKDLCKKIEMTESGFNIALKNNTLKIETLQKIAKVLKVDISYFFINEYSNEEAKKRFLDLVNENIFLKYKVEKLINSRFKLILSLRILREYDFKNVEYHKILQKAYKNLDINVNINELDFEYKDLLMNEIDKSLASLTKEFTELINSVNL